MHPEHQNDSPADRHREKPTIAVIDDEQIWLKTFLRFFKNSAYAIDVFSDPQDFLRTIARQPDRYVGIICDIQMPQIDGYQVFAELKKNSRTRNIPFLIVSGVLTQDQNLCRVQGMTYVSKLDENLREKIFTELIDVVEKWPRVKKYLQSRAVPDERIEFFFQFYINYHTYFNDILGYVTQMEQACVRSDFAAIARINRQCADYMERLQVSCMDLITLIQENAETNDFVRDLCKRARTSLNMIQMFQLILAEEPSSHQDFRAFLQSCRDSLEKIIVGAAKGYNLRNLP